MADKAKTPKWLTWILGIGGLTLAFMWGFAEGTLFFVIPDLVVTLTALFSIKKAFLQAIAITLGALIAGALMYTWSTQNYEQSYETVMSVPLLKTEMATEVRDNYEAHGAAAILMGPLSGIPYKLYAIEAPEFISMSSFLLMSLPARFGRMLLGLLFFGAIGLWQRKRITCYPNRAFFGYGLYWMSIYVAYIILI